jgi:hypothetical protein
MWLWLDDPRSPLELAPGDVALVRGGPDHFIAHKPNAACLPPDQFQARHAEDERAAAQGANVFLCGAYVLSGDVGRGLLEALPPILSLSAAADRLWIGGRASSSPRPTSPESTYAPQRNTFAS